MKVDLGNKDVIEALLFPETPDMERLKVRVAALDEQVGGLLQQMLELVALVKSVDETHQQIRLFMGLQKELNHRLLAANRERRNSIPERQGSDDA